jgi:hypothetical protein
MGGGVGGERHYFPYFHVVLRRSTANLGKLFHTMRPAPFFFFLSLGLGGTDRLEGAESIGGRSEIAPFFFFFFFFFFFIGIPPNLDRIRLPTNTLKL